MSLPPVPSFRPLGNSKSIVVAPNVRFTVLTDRIIRIEFSQINQFEDRPSQVFWYREQPVPRFKKKITDKVIEIETKYLHLIYKPGRTGFTPRNLSIKLKNSRTTWHYGASAAKAGNLKGTARTLDGVAGKTKLEDGLVSTAGWSVVDDSKTLVFDENGWLVPRTNKKSLDFYFFGYGADIPGLLRDYTRIAGEIPMIPRYILGNWWSRYWAYTQDELQSLMQEFRAREIPLSVCIIDMDWHLTKTGNQSPGWTGYTWNRELFPDPQGFIAWLHSQGLRTALNLHPAAGVYPHEEQYADMAKWMGMDPNSKTPVTFDISDRRFMEGYFELLHHPFESSSPSGRGVSEGAVDFWWMDWQQGKSSRVKGLDPLWGLNHLHFQDLGRDGKKRPFVFSRWGGLGNHRYPIGFSGDTIIEWSSLAFQPYFTSTAANVAYGWWSHDIGGHFRVDGTPELYLRWVQFGVFSPIFRLHSSNMPKLDRRPWGNKPDRIYHAARDAMQLRHALIPYLYSMAWRAHQTGLSLVAPMYYGNMDSSEAHKAKDQYFFGSELIAAPVIKPVNEKTGFATQKIWIPRGTWFNFFTGERITGGTWHAIKSTLEDIPLYAKAGAIIPLAPKVAWGGIENPKVLDIYVFPGKDNAFELYEDDGETTDFQRGKYAMTTFTLKKNTFTIQPVSGDTSLIPSQRTYRIHLRGVEEKTKASLPGQYDVSTRTLLLDSVTLKPTDSLQVELKTK